jgi:hypothetical protein
VLAIFYLIFLTLFIDLFLILPLSLVVFIIVTLHWFLICKLKDPALLPLLKVILKIGGGLEKVRFTILQ